MEKLINSLAKEYKFKVNIINNNTFTVKSHYDEWFVEYDIVREKMFLHHKNTKKSKALNDKHYHLQKAFNIFDLNKVFGKIKRHDDFRIHHKNTNKLDNLFELIKNNNTNYIKFS